jgi:glycosyltransferase involved in cell wall biosynthesis
VSVVIPVYNRAGSVGRAITSALEQSEAPLEIVVVDDGSTDASCEVVARLAAQEPRIRLVRQQTNLGGAAARNVGLLETRAEFVAFLDSDDEWLADHLERRVRLLRARPAVGLVFGSFFLDSGKTRHLDRCAPFSGDPLEYLFGPRGARGGLRTSTFVGRRAALLEVRFADCLRKHQDWDLAVNVGRRFGILADPQPTVILHASSPDRLSSRLDHASTLEFYRRNREHCSRTGWILFCSVMLELTYRYEGRSDNFRHYLQLLRAIDPRAYTVLGGLTTLLWMPRIGGRAFRAVSRRWCFATARSRERGRLRQHL